MCLRQFLVVNNDGCEFIQLVVAVLYMPVFYVLGVFSRVTVGVSIEGFSHFRVYGENQPRDHESNYSLAICNISHSD